MATQPPYAYAFDPTGTSAANKITGEQQVITAANYRDYHFIVPTFAPFFATGLVVKFRDTNGVVSTLTEGVDYLLTHWFIAASRACATPIYGSISFTNLNLAGTVIIDYQTLGGMWTQDTATLSAILADLIHNPRITSWDVVTDQPVSFPVIDHQWDLVDLAGASDVIAAINAIETTLRSTGTTGLAAHLIDYSNPHHVTAAQIGLGNVQNYGVADGPTTVAGTVANLYVTPYGVQAALAAGPNAAIGTHVARNDNPHAVTAAQVGAYTQTQVNSLLVAKLSTTGVAYDTARFNTLSPSEYRDWAMSTGVAANSLLFNGLSAGDYKSFVLTGKAADSASLNGYSYAQVLANAQAGDAANALMFGGQTPAQFTVSVLAGTAANSAMFNGMTGPQWESYLGQKFGSVGSTASQGVQQHTSGETAGSYWLELGRAFFPGANPLSSQQDVHWTVAGGDSNGDTVSGLRFLHLSTRGGAGSDANGVAYSLINLDGVEGTGQLGYTVGLVDDGTGAMVQTCQVWLKVSANHGTVTVTALAQGTSKVLGASTEVTVEPAGISYMVENITGVASKASVDQLRSDTQAALDSITTAFTTLATNVAAS